MHAACKQLVGPPLDAHWSQVKSHPDCTAALHIAEEHGQLQETAYERLYKFIQRKFRTVDLSLAGRSPNRLSHRFQANVVC